MTSPSTNPRFKRSMQALALSLALMLGASGCITAEQTRVTAFVNNSREARNIRPVQQNLQLSIKAQRWAEYLARIGRLQHSNLSDGITVRWRALGENVGYGRDIRSVHQAYMRSSGHRATILDGRYNYIGTGYAKRGNTTYTVQVFMQY